MHVDRPESNFEPMLKLRLIEKLNYVCIKKLFAGCRPNYVCIKSFSPLLPLELLLPKPKQLLLKGTQYLTSSCLSKNTLTMVIRPTFWKITKNGAKILKKSRSCSRFLLLFHFCCITRHKSVQFQG